MSAAVVEAALALWGLDRASYRLVAERENRVFQIHHAGQRYALRLHRPGYRSDAELISELQMMAAAGRAGLNVPNPVPSAAKELFHVVDGTQIDLLEWLEGEVIGTTTEPLAPAHGSDLFQRIGVETARLHVALDAWTPPAGFTRCHWDRAGLLGDAPLWGRFWDNPTLTPDDRDLFIRLRNRAEAVLAGQGDDLDYGLIHADLVRENLMISGDRLQLIDFDDAGFGFRLYELVTTLLKNLGEPHYDALHAALLDGYHSRRSLDLEHLDMFMALRAASYVGWIVPRLEEPGAAARNTRFITTARRLTRAWLDDAAVA
ncbi:phosphotransferase enzyme family protein [Palleronia sp.]|uniref:phosphotransferase enzyme family protein n=1 Tax=Palleronia sp. TaxID=1940284 RepID=UPI0035C87159